MEKSPWWGASSNTVLLGWLNQGRWYKISVGKPEEKKTHEDVQVDGRITLKWIIRKQNMSGWTGSIG